MNAIESPVLANPAREELSSGGAATPIAGGLNTLAADVACEPPVGASIGLPSPFGRYQLIERLGAGGMGVVYLALDTQLRRRVALKTPLFCPEEGSAGPERFLREARAAAALDHPGICPVYDFGEIDGAAFLTMPLIEGISLGEWLRRFGRPAPREAVELAMALARALAHAHSRGVVHRDLKPSNVMLRTKAGVDHSSEGACPSLSDHEPVLMDFGLARTLHDGDVQLTTSGLLVGTPTYMAPEQVLGESGAIGPPCDVHGMGVILFMLLAGRPPFEGPATALFARIAAEPAPPPSRFNPLIDRRLDAIVLRALAKRPQDRFANMTSLGAELDRWMQGGESPALSLRRLPRRAVVAAIVVASAIAGWRLVATGGSSDESESRSAESSDRRPQPPAADAPSRRDSPVSKTARRLVPAAPDEDANQAMIQDDDLAALAPRTRALVERLDDDSREVRTNAARSLLELHDAAAAPWLARRVQDDVANSIFTEDKDAALDALIALAPEQTCPALVGALQSANDATRRWSAEALGEQTTTLARDALIGALNDETVAVRAAAAKSLGQLGDAEAVDALVELVARDLTSFGMDDKRAALDALDLLEPGKSQAAILRAMQSADAKVRAWAANQGDRLK